MNRDVWIADIEQAIREDSEACSELIARHLDIDHPWLSEALADVLRHVGTPESLGRLYTAAEKHLGPVITAQAVADLEMREDV